MTWSTGRGMFVYVCLFLWPAIAAAANPPRSLDKRLTIERFAAEPEIVTPTGIAVDARGRVLVVENHTHFPPEGYKGPKTDRIRLFEDADGDGKPEKVTTFHEGTKMTMGLAAARDGSVIATTRSEILRLKDLDGDGESDEAVVLVRLETAGNYPHNGLFGCCFDARGDLCFGLGENLGADYKLIGADGTTLSGGGEGGSIYRCRPDGKGLVRLATGFWNPAHQAVDPFGRIFSVDNDPDSRPPCRLIHVVEGGDYGFRYRNGRKGLHPFTSWNGEIPGTLPMVAGTGEAPAGLVVYESDGLPEDYRGNLLSTTWGEHRIDRFKLKERGASFQSVLEPMIVGGEDFRPVDVAVAPDGSLYITDWVDKSYNVHGKGRIWRVKGVEAPRREPSADLFQALSHADLPIRRRAARMIAGAGEEGRIALRWAIRDKPDPRARAVALEALNPDEETHDAESLSLALRDKEPAVRAMAVRLAPEGLADFTRIARDDVSAAVRAEAFRRANKAESVSTLLNALEGDDPFGSLAARIGLRRLMDVRELSELLSTTAAPGARLGLLLALRETTNPEASRVIATCLSDPDPRIRFAAIQWAAEENLTKYRKRIEDGLAAGDDDRRLFEGRLAALELLDRGGRPAGQEISGDDYIAKLLTADGTTPAARVRALRILRPDHPVLTIDRLKTFLSSPDADVRKEAVRSLRENLDPRRIEILTDLASRATESEPLRAEAIMGLSGEQESTRSLLLSVAESEKPAPRREALRSLRGASLTPDQLSRLAESNTSDPPSASLVAFLKAPPVEADRPGAENLDGWLKLLEGPADPAEGERVFHHPRGVGCYRCHQVDGRGGRVGPDLTTTAKVLTLPRLIESILQPSKEVAPQFVTWTIAKTDGTTATGILLVETGGRDQTYIDSQGKPFVLREQDIEARAPSPASIMPQGLERAMTLQEFRDLIAFLRADRK